MRAGRMDVWLNRGAHCDRYWCPGLVLSPGLRLERHGVPVTREGRVRKDFRESRESDNRSILEAGWSVTLANRSRSSVSLIGDQTSRPSIKLPIQIKPDSLARMPSSLAPTAAESRIVYGGSIMDRSLVG